jgi:hypothetical protein
LKDSPGNVDYLWYYRNNRRELAANLLDLGDHAAAADTAEQLVRAVLEPGLDLYAAASFLARAVPLAEKDSRLPPKCAGAAPGNTRTGLSSCCARRWPRVTVIWTT